MNNEAGTYVYDSVLEVMPPAQAIILCQLVYLSKNEAGLYCYPSITYLSKKIGATRATTVKILKKLVDKGYIIKEQNYIEGTNGKKTNKYYLTDKTKSLIPGLKDTLPSIESIPPSIESIPDLVQKVYHPSIESIPVNNIKKELNKNTSLEEVKKIPYDEIVGMYNSICVRLKEVKSITYNRMQYIKDRYLENNEDISIFQEVFEKANASDYFCGDNENSWQGDFNWIMKSQDHFIQVLEDKYINRKQSKTKTQTDKDKAYNEYVTRQLQEMELEDLENE